MRRRVLITGSSGFVGKALLERWLATRSSPPITVAVRRDSDVEGGPRVEKIEDIGPDTVWDDCLPGVEVVIHLAARVHVMDDRSSDPLRDYRRVNVAGTLNLARQAACTGARRFVFISSIKVNGEGTSDGRLFRADDPPAPEDFYGLSKLEAERGLQALAHETGMEVVIIRPPLVYGPGVKGNFASMVGWVRRGLPLPLGSVDNRRSLVAIDNLVDFIALCADRERSPQAANKVFLVSDADDVSTPQLLRRVARAHGVSARLIPFPSVGLRFAARLLGRADAVDRLLGSLVVDAAPARDILGWRPVITMDQQLKKMALYDPSL